MVFFFFAKIMINSSPISMKDICFGLGDSFFVVLSFVFSSSRMEKRTKPKPLSPHLLSGNFEINNSLRFYMCFGDTSDLDMANPAFVMDYEPAYF